MESSFIDDIFITIRAENGHLSVSKLVKESEMIWSKWKVFINIEMVKSKVKINGQTLSDMV